MNNKIYQSTAKVLLILVLVGMTGFSRLANTGAFFYSNVTGADSEIQTGDWSPPKVPELYQYINDAVVNSDSKQQCWEKVEDSLGGEITYYYESYHDSELANLRWQGIFSNSTNTGPCSEFGTSIIKDFSGAPEGDVFWRVMACDERGNCSDWSNTGHFVIDNTEPQVPETLGFNSTKEDYSDRNLEIECGGTAFQNQVSHHWEDIEDAVLYQRQWVYPGGNPDNEADWHGSETWETAYTNYRLLGGDPGQEGKWHFRVRAQDEAGNWSDYSEACSLYYYERPEYEVQEGCPEGTIPVLEHSLGIDSSDEDGEAVTLKAGSYLFEVEGEYKHTPGDPTKVADAGYTSFDSWTTLNTNMGIFEEAEYRGVTALLGDLGQGVGIIPWGDYNSQHQYSVGYSLNKNYNAKFLISDWYGLWYPHRCEDQSCSYNNIGSLDLNIYRCQAEQWVGPEYQRSCESGFKDVSLGAIDHLDIGDTDSENNHTPFTGWSSNDWPSGFSIENETDKSHRQIVETACGNDTRQATFTLDAGSNYAEFLKIRALDGISGADSLDVYVDDVLIGRHFDLTPGSEGEAWQTLEFPLNNLTGSLEVRLVATGPFWHGCENWGQVAVSWVEIEGYACQEDIVLNEIMFDPVDESSGAEMPDGEWVELYNNTSIDVDVAGWEIEDANVVWQTISLENSDNDSDYMDEGETIIPSGGRLVVYRNGNGILNNGGDTVKLFNSSGQLLDSYEYTGDKNEGETVARDPDGTGIWVDPLPNPGRKNVIDPVDFDPQLKIWQQDENHAYIGLFDAVNYENAQCVVTYQHQEEGMDDPIGGGFIEEINIDKTTIYKEDLFMGSESNGIQYQHTNISEVAIECELSGPSIPTRTLNTEMEGSWE